MKKISRFIKDFFEGQDLLRLIVGNQHMNYFISVSKFIDDVLSYVLDAKIFNFYECRNFDNFMARLL